MFGILDRHVLPSGAGHPEASRIIECSTGGELRGHLSECTKISFIASLDDSYLTSAMICLLFVCLAKDYAPYTVLKTSQIQVRWSPNNPMTEAWSSSPFYR